MFGLSNDDKEIFNISTRTDKSDKIRITRKYLLDPDLLSILLMLNQVLRFRFYGLL